MTGNTDLQNDAGLTPSFAEAVRVWLHVGLTSFGGPAGQIALMHRVLVEQKRWLDERTYLLALNFCTLLPGPEAMQLATYAGWRLHGVSGGLAAGLLFVLPGAAVILALAVLYGFYGNLPVIAAIFTGIKAAVLAIVVEALLKISRRSLQDGIEWVIAVLSFTAIFFFKVPFPVIVMVAAIIGYGRGIGVAVAEPHTVPARVPLGGTLKTVSLWLAVWLLPLAAIEITFGANHVLAKLAQVFATLAVVTFGGAYAVLAYLSQDIVQVYGWLSPGEMLDGLGLAETTPGPLILVTEFVGYLAAYRHGGAPPLLMGLLGAFVALWATFVPSFLFIFAGAPYVEWLKSAPRLKSALNAITAAVVGVILNLTVWFTLHVLFRSVSESRIGPLHVTAPDLASLDFVTLAIAAVATSLIFIVRVGILPTLAVCGALSLVAAYAGNAG